MITPLALSALVKHHGFDDFGVCSIPDGWHAEAHLREFVAKGFHGEMHWMETTLERRVHPKKLWEGANSALVLAKSYAPDCDPLTHLGQTDCGNISVYARGDDYHDVVKKALKALAGDIVRQSPTELKVFVDTAALMEKPLAQLGGLGWQGKHTNLVSRALGNWFFIGVILLEGHLEETTPETDHCGSCRACLDICPTGAIIAPYQLDARLCLSYLSIEFDGPWPEDLRPKMGNRIYGCDDCLAICPWNKFAVTAHEGPLSARESLTMPLLSDLLRLDEAEFRALFAKTAIKRIGIKRFLRNVAYAAGNHLRECDDQALVGALLHLCHCDDDVVREAAHWALDQRSKPCGLDY